MTHHRFLFEFVFGFVGPARNVLWTGASGLNHVYGRSCRLWGCSIWYLQEFLFDLYHTQNVQIAISLISILLFYYLL